MSALGDLLRILAQANHPSGGSSTGQDVLSNALGGLLGSSQGSGQADQVLGSLEQMIAGGGQNKVQNMNMTGEDPMLNLVQPVADQLSRRTGLQPETSRAVVSLILHRMLTSHPSMGSKNSSLNLPEVFQQMATSGGISTETLQKSGMINDLINSSGLDKQASIKNLSEAFNLLNGHVQNTTHQ
jgi:hypothetical protein